MPIKTDNRTHMSEIKGRFAPSPTGRMHLGNLYAALMSWHSARSKGGTWLLRIEDIDRQRSRREYAEMLEDDLRWLGLEWDEGGLEGKGNSGPYLQSLRDDVYARYLGMLEAKGLVYPCRCSRADIMASSAPHQSDGRVVYGGRCRPRYLGGTACADTEEETSGELCGSMTARRASLRLFVPDEDIRFTDLIAGPQCYNLARDCGDFIVRRADGGWSYQLAVVVDDALMGVTEVVRGEDLLLSAAQQIYMFGLLGFAPPAYAHFPLLRNGEGQRLSKRDHAESMETLRLTHTPESLLGRLAQMAGLRVDSTPVTADELLKI